LFVALARVGEAVARVLASWRCHVGRPRAMHEGLARHDDLDESAQYAATVRRDVAGVGMSDLFPAFDFDHVVPPTASSPRLGRLRAGAGVAVDQAARRR